MRIRVLGLILVPLFLYVSDHASCGPLPDAPNEEHTPGRGTVESGLSDLARSDNLYLSKALSGYSVGQAVAAHNLAVVPILTVNRDEPQGGFVALDEALSSDLLVIEEIGEGGAVPTLQVSSKHNRAILLPFGAIVTGGKQDRMIREDMVLKPGETKDVSVYCVEAGRWSAPDSGLAFKLSGSLASTRLKSLSNSDVSQSRVWRDVSWSNDVFLNRSTTANFQGNLETEKFKDSAAELEPVKKAIGAQSGVCGAVIVVDGKVSGAEVFASSDYFSNLWPQLFDSYVIDATLSEGSTEAEPEEAEEAARHYLSLIGSASITQTERDGEIRLAIESVGHRGYALIEAQEGRLVHLRLFPKMREVAE